MGVRHNSLDYLIFTNFKFRSSRCATFCYTMPRSRLRHFPKSFIRIPRQTRISLTRALCASVRCNRLSYSGSFNLSSISTSVETSARRAYLNSTSRSAHSLELWEQQKITDLRFHDLRHAAGTRMGNASTHAFTLTAIFGWSDIRMAMRYTHAVEDVKRKAVEAIAPSNQPHVKVQRFKFHVTGA